MATQEPGSVEVELQRTATESGLPDDKFDYVLSFKAKDEVTQETTSCFGMKKKDTSAKVKERARIIKRLSQVGLLISKVKSADGSEIYYRIGAEQKRIEEQAERMNFQLKLKKDYGSGYAEFKIDRKHLFEGTADDKFFSSLQRQAIIKDIIENKKRDGGAEINMAREVKKGNILSFFPLHEDKMTQILLQSWASPGAAFRSYFINQPLDDVRAYLGESVAMYFAWLGHYTKWLGYSSIVGIIIFIIQMTVAIDQGAELVFAVFLAFWATFFLESWKRHNAEIAFKWNMLDFEATEKTRPEFSGEDKTGVWANGVFVELSPEEGGKLESAPTATYFKPGIRFLRILAGLPFIFMIIICVVAATIGVIVIRVVLQNIAPAYAVVASIINAIAIIILNIVYQKLAAALNDWENHRTETDYQDALISKTFAFQFVNSYISLFYIAYFKRQRRVVSLSDGTVDDDCKFGGQCITELMVQLATILATNIFIGQTQEVGIPYIMNLIKARSDKQRASKSQEGLSKEEQKKLAKSLKLSKVERESNYARYGGTFGEYNEMVIQYGYVTMFAAAFPLAPALAFVNNIVEIRTDSFKFLTSIQRPEYQGAQDIGTWYKILNIIGFVAVLTNCLIVSVTSTQLRNKFFTTPDVFANAPVMATILASVVLEHIIILAKFIVSEVIPDEPEGVRVELARQNYFKDQALVTEEVEDGLKVPEFDDTITAEDESL